MIDRSNRILFAMDLSNFKYMCVFCAVRDWKKAYPEDSSFMVNKWRTDQENLPDLLNHQSFRRVLSRTVHDKFEFMLNIAKKYHQTEIDVAEGMDIFLTEDDRLSGNFRKRIYPEYKQQRKATLYEFDVFKVLDYISGVVLPEMELEKRFGCKIVKVKDCESDDIIAVLMNRYTDYMCRILVSSDRDYLQLKDVHQYTIFGHPLLLSMKVGDKVLDFENPTEYLLFKIVRGDVSDNIKGVFPKYGDIKSFRLVRDKPLLKKMLKEDNSAALRFKRNKSLIDFRLIPEDVRKRVAEVLDGKMGEIRPPEKVDFGSCMILKG